MIRNPVAFFTLDRGTATTTAALIARVEDRFRLLGARAIPTSLPVDALLASLATQAAAVEQHGLPPHSTWPDWPRLESATGAPARVCIAAANERRLTDLDLAATNAGWIVTGRITPDRTDALEATSLCLDRDLDAVVVAAGDPATSDERSALPDLVALVSASVAARTDVLVVLAGAAGEHAEPFKAERVILAPAPEAAVSGQATPLRDLFERLGSRRVSSMSGSRSSTSSRLGYRAAIVSLAAVLDRRVEGVEVGYGGGSRVLAAPGGLNASMTRADGALVPDAPPGDDRPLDDVLAWSPIRGDRFELRDRVRNLRLAPWRDATGDGARLRLAAARAALARMDAAWEVPADPAAPPEAPPDLVVASGGAFSLAPAPAVALAVVDALRRPGASALYLDHARVLAPLGTIENEKDRRRMLADLLDDVLVPLGSAVVAAGLRPGRRAGTLRVASEGTTTEVELVPGAVQLVDLPPGLGATIELETREGAWLGVKARRIALDVVGGLGGLLIDTRDVPLRLPDRAERRRELLDAWQRPLWPTTDG